MTAPAELQRRPFDPERHARRLAPAGALCVVVGSCAGGWPGAGLALLGLGLLLACCYSAHDGFLLLGPLTVAELTRAARLRRPWLWRSVYALAAGAVMLGMVADQAPGLLDLDVKWYSPNTIARINGNVTAAFAVALAAYAVVLTVQLVPSVVAEERQAKRWDLLLTTDLRPREILLGKVAARLVQVFEPTLAVLPVLAVMPLLGGVSPVAVALFGVALLAVVVSTAAVGAFYSLYARTEQKARREVRGFLMLYYLLGGMLMLFVRVPQVGAFPVSVGVPSPVTLDGVVNVLAVGHPLTLLTPVQRGAMSFEAAMAAGLPAFLAFHLGVTLLFVLTACQHLRHAEVWAKQPRGVTRRVRRAERSRGETPAAPVAARTATERPPVTDASIEWWARYGHLRGRLGLDVVNPGKFGGKVFVTVAVVLLLVYMLDISWYVIFRSTPGNWIKGVGIVVPMVLWCVTIPLVMRPLFHAAGSIAGERQADTLTGLLLAPLTSREIVVQKWRGSIRESVGLYAFFVGAGLAATLTGFLHPLSLPVTAVVVVPGMALAAAIGVFFSANATTAARAKRWTALAVFGGGYLAAVVSMWVLSSLKVKLGDSAALLLAIPCPPVTTGLPMMLGPLSQDNVSLRGSRAVSVVSGAACIAAGVIFQSAAAWLFLVSAAQKFERARHA